ncbi:hypothetical protein GT625_13670 [Burkholderia thailandensis]|uniref:right-handed parallel beta-helix repeat-containing protein n=1 Tax=Burkholderia thailandensis TaxID=57975 RepID=UPI0013787CC7|nr:right-handed parallel beta-helix repeat-containing protein [Burkholderia thailandensis]NBJ19774.1 hypothetical protein [Burkholderia thailandensis]
MGNMVINPIAFFPDLLGLPLQDGAVYIGVANTNPVTNPVTVYQDAAMTIPMQQPLSVNNGFITLNGSPQTVYVSGASYSIAVNDAFGDLVLSIPNYTNQLMSQTGAGGAALIGFDGTTLDQVFKLRMRRVVPNLVALRALSGTLYGLAETEGALAAGDGGGTLFRANYSDTTSADNGVTLIVGTDGTRWYAENMRVIDTRQAGLHADGITDDSAAIQKALNCGAIAVRHVVNSAISTYLTVPAGVRFFGNGEGSKLTALNNMPAYGPWGSAHQGQSVLLNGDGACVEGIYIYGANFNAGGVGTFNFYRNRISKCLITNTGNSQGTMSTSSQYLNASENTIIYAPGSDGMEGWQCAFSNWENNIIDVVGAGGIFITDCASCLISGNTVTNCGDVGVDMEGGVNCLATGNTVGSCCNGELTWFGNGTGSGRVPTSCSFTGNNVIRSATYQAGLTRTATPCNASAGGMRVVTVTAGQEAISFNGNNVYAQSPMTALYVDDLGGSNCGVSIVGNTFTSQGTLFRINRAYDIKIQANNFHGIGAASALENIFKNCDLGLFEGNTIEYETTKNTNYALRYYTDIAITNSPTISNNIFKNCGMFAFLHDPFVSAIPAYVEENTFAESPQTNGGMDSTANAYPIYRNQVLNILINENNTGTAVSVDLNTISALKGNTPPLNWGRGSLGCVDGNFGNLYNVTYDAGAVHIYSDNGSGSASGLTASTSRYATFSGSTITITGPDNAVYGLLKLTMDTAG